MQETVQGDTSVLDTLFHHNTWANLKLLEFCEGLSDEQLDASAVGGFGTIRNTLHHIVRAEVGYVARVNGKSPTKPVPRDQFPGFAVLKDAVRWTGEELLQLAISTRKDTIVCESEPGESVEYPRASLMVQTLNHSTEHRTQIASIITQLGMVPPDMSGWNYMEENGEYQIFNEGTEGTTP